MLENLQDEFDAASRRYCEANGFPRDGDWILVKMQEEMGELTQAVLRASGRARAKGRSEAEMAQDLAEETADLLGMVLIFARHHGIDLAPAVARKWRFDPRPAALADEGGAPAPPPRSVTPAG